MSGQYLFVSLFLVISKKKKMLGTVKLLYDPAKERQDANIVLVLMI